MIPSHPKINARQSNLSRMSKECHREAFAFLVSFKVWSYFYMNRSLKQQRNGPSLGDFVRFPRHRSDTEVYTRVASLVAHVVKNPPPMQETLVQFLGQEDTLEKG